MGVSETGTRGREGREKKIGALRVDEGPVKMRRKSKRPKASSILFFPSLGPFLANQAYHLPGCASVAKGLSWLCPKVAAICSLEEASSTGACLPATNHPAKKTTSSIPSTKWCGREGIEIRIGFRFWTDHCPVIDQSQWIVVIPGSSPTTENPLFLRRLIANIKTSNPDHQRGPLVATGGLDECWGEWGHGNSISDVVGRDNLQRREQRDRDAYLIPYYVPQAIRAVS